MAVIFYNWESSKTAFFYAQAIILHGSINSVFVCEDFISVYVALEVISIAAFLVIAYPRSDRSLWVALRYLFISNVAMLFYLIGAVLVNLDTGKLIAILEKRTQEELKKTLTGWGKEELEQIEEVSIDLWLPSIRVAKRTCIRQIFAKMVTSHSPWAQSWAQPDACKQARKIPWGGSEGVNNTWGSILTAQGVIGGLCSTLGGLRYVRSYGDDRR